MTVEPRASFFVNSGLVSNRHDMYHLLRPLLRNAVAYRYFRAGRLVSWGTGPVDRVLVGRPDLSSFFTPVSVCINIGSFDFLEFETLPDVGLEYRLVQGKERVLLFLLPGSPQGDGGAVQETLGLQAPDYVQLELSGMGASETRPGPGSGGVAGGAEGR